MLGKPELSLGSPSTWGSRGAGQKELFPLLTTSNGQWRKFSGAAGRGQADVPITSGLGSD